MTWWGWLLLGAGLAAVAALGLWLLLRRVGSRDVDREALAKSERVRLRANLEAERERRVEAERVARDLEEELRGIAKKRKEELDAADENARARARELADDPDALLERLDEILRRAPDDGG